MSSPPTGTEVWPRLGPHSHRCCAPQYRMRFPHDSFKPGIYNVGIATFSDFIEISPNRIACEFSEEWAYGCARVSRIFRVKLLSPLLARARVGSKPVAPLLVSTCVGLKLLSPLLAQAEPQLKPPSPLRGRNGRFWCVFWLQRCCRFQRLLFRGEQRCLGFQISGDRRLQRRHGLHMPVA